MISKHNWPLFALLVVVMAILIALAGCSGEYAVARVGEITAAARVSRIELNEDFDMQLNGVTGNITQTFNRTIQDSNSDSKVREVVQTVLISIWMVWANKRQLRQINGKT